MKTLLAIMLFVTNSVFCQPGDHRTGKPYSAETKSILRRLDSLLKLDFPGKRTPHLEFRIVGEDSRISEKFLLYAQLTKRATEQELLDILADQKEYAAIRAYAYMAYAYKCDQEKKKENPLDYKFKVWAQSGCVISPYTFAEFKKTVRTRNKYEPDPKKNVVPAEETEVIKQENKIRQEQGLNPRKQ